MVDCVVLKAKSSLSDLHKRKLPTGHIIIEFLKLSRLQINKFIILTLDIRICFLLQLCRLELPYVANKLMVFGSLQLFTNGLNFQF